MAKKKVSKKKTTKKTASNGASRTSTRSSKKAAAKKVTKKTVKKTAKKPTTKSSKKVAKKTAAKKVTKKKVAKKKVAKKSTKKVSAKKTTKKAAASKKVSKKTTEKSTAPSKATTSKTTKKSTKKTSKKTASKASGSTSSGSKSAVKPDTTPATQTKSPTTKKRRPSKSKKPVLVMPTRPLLLGPNGPALKPLIPSGKDNKLEPSVLDNVTSRRTKTPLTKTQLEKYRMILLTKRAELLGDMRHLEDEALRSDSGRSSSTSQHLDEAGSESYEQSLNLNLAAAERERINEIDAALERIENRTYGLCELTFEPISKVRLDEIPWARYTIAAAREMDRRGISR